MSFQTLLPVLCFPALFCFICFVTSLLSGWQKLAQLFRATSKPTGQSFFQQRALFNGVNYNAVLTFIVADAGLYLSVFPLFAFGHAPLLIPWSAFNTFQTRKTLWIVGKETLISLPSGGNVAMMLYNLKIVASIEEQRAKNAFSQAFSSI